MLLKELLQKGIEILKTCDIAAPALEAGVILSYALKKDKIYLYTHGDTEIPDKTGEIYLCYINERKNGKPLQYITGFQEFMSLEFKVAPEVLIPRYDTETLVEAVIAEAKQLKEKINILDIGTGSGCIAISLAHYIDNCHITAVDISEKALILARINARTNKVDEKITFTKSDLFENLKGSFDIIVSNPPYIETGIIKTLKKEVKDHEPLNALDGGEDGLDFYRKIVETAPEFLGENGILAFEIGYTQADYVKQLMKKDFQDINVIKDLSQNDRVVLGHVFSPSKCG